MFRNMICNVYRVRVPLGGMRTKIWKTPLAVLAASAASLAMLPASSASAADSRIGFWTWSVKTWHDPRDDGGISGALNVYYLVDGVEKRHIVTGTFHAYDERIILNNRSNDEAKVTVEAKDKNGKYKRLGGMQNIAGNIARSNESWPENRRVRITVCASPSNGWNCYTHSGYDPPGKMRT